MREETDQSPAAYSCVFDDGLMIRCVGLRDVLLSFYGSLLPLLNDLSENYCHGEPAVVLGC